jgi:tetratricopeptide (TPR) repeat protein
MDPRRIPVRPAASTLLALALLLSGCTSSKSRPLRPVEPDVKLAERATKAGEWRSAAERWYAVWQESSGSDLRACAEASRALLELGDANSAVNLLDQGLALEPGNAGLLELKARALTQLGYRRAAQEYLERALASDPACSSARLELARLRFELGLPNAALPLLREHVERTGGDGPSYALLARVLRATGDGPGAFDAWRASFQRGPASVPDLLAAAALGLDEVVLAAHPEAGSVSRDWLQQAIASDPQCTPAHFQLGLMSEGAGAYEEAVQHYRRAVETDPACLAALTNLAILHAGRGEEVPAREMVGRALQLETDPVRRAALAALLAPFELGTPEGPKLPEVPPDD